MRLKPALLKITSILLPQNYSLKNTFQKTRFKIAPSILHFKIFLTKIFFISASINAVKDRISIDKSLKVHGSMLAIHY